MVQAAQHHDAQTLDLLQTVPGIGTLLRRGLLEAIPAIARLPRGHDVVSSGRLVTCAQASAGKRSGFSGTKSGQASLQGAFSAAAVLLLRAHPAGQTVLTRVENKHGQGQAWTVLAQTLARAVSDLLTRHRACARQTWLQGSGSGARAPLASRDIPGLSLERARCLGDRRASRTPKRAEVGCPALCAVDWTRAPAPGPGHRAFVAASARVLPLTRT